MEGPEYRSMLPALHRYLTFKYTYSISANDKSVLLISYDPTCRSRDLKLGPEPQVENLVSWLTCMSVFSVQTSQTSCLTVSYLIHLELSSPGSLIERPSPAPSGIPHGKGRDFLSTEDSGELL